MSRDVTKSEVRHMAQLSKLTITQYEEELFCRQFGDILGHMEILNSIDTSNIEPLYNPINKNGETRFDEAKNIRTRSEILANAPETDGYSFIVPKIV